MKSHYDKRWERMRHMAQRNIFVTEKPRTQLEFQYRQYNQFIGKLLSSHFVDTHGIRLMEAGCGRGTTSLYLSKLHGVSCTMLDFSAQALTLAHDNFAREKIDGYFAQGDVIRLPFRDEGFDAVISLGLLEHFADIDEPIREMTRTLRPNGLFISLNAPYPGFSIAKMGATYHGVATWALRARRYTLHWNRLIQKLRDRQAIHGNDHFYRSSYTASHFKARAEAMGLSRVEVLGVNPFPLLRPMPAWGDTVMIRLYSFLLELRRRLGASEPFATSLRWAPVHFLWGVKP